MRDQHRFTVGDVLLALGALALVAIVDASNLATERKRAAAKAGRPVVPLSQLSVERLWSEQCHDLTEDGFRIQCAACEGWMIVSRDTSSIRAYVNEPQFTHSHCVCMGRRADGTRCGMINVDWTDLSLNECLDAGLEILLFADAPRELLDLVAGEMPHTPKAAEASELQVLIHGRALQSAFRQATGE